MKTAHSRKSRSKEALRGKLHIPGVAAKYLTVCYEEGTEEFLDGLRDVVAASGGVVRASQLTKLPRQSLYRVCARDGNPRLSSLDAVLAGLEMKVIFKAGCRRWI